MRKHKDLIGTTYGKLTVITKADKDHLSKFRWACRCDCGKIITIREDALLRNNEKLLKSCGCEQIKAFWKGHGEISGHFWCHVRKSAEKRNHSLDVTIDQAWDQFLLQDRKCALTGLELKFARNHRDDNLLQTASLDRINNNLGYQPGNIQWLHKDVNWLKQDLSVGELRYWADLITNRKNFPIMEECYGKRKNSKWSGYEEISGSYLCSLRTNAKKRGMEFLLSGQEIWKLFLDQNRRCVLTGLPLRFVVNYHSDKISQTASLDRIDSKKAYTIDNVQWVHKRVNYLKNVFDVEELVHWCSLITQRHHNCTKK